MSNYFVIYKGTGEKELIPEVIANAIWEAKSPTIRWKSKLGLRKIDLANVGNLYSEEEYYQNHPEERPATEEQINKILPIKKYEKIEVINALNEMIKGLNYFIKNNKNNFKSNILLDKMNKKLKLVEEGNIKLETIKDLIKF